MISICKKRVDLRVALHYIILKCFLFSKRNAGALVFQHSKKRDKDKRKKKQNFISQAD